MIERDEQPIEVESRACYVDGENHGRSEYPLKVGWHYQARVRSQDTEWHWSREVYATKEAAEIAGRQYAARARDGEKDIREEKRIKELGLK